MSDVISNTSPLQYLHQSEMLFLLPQLVGSIIVPPAVVDELNEGRMSGINLPIPESLSWVNIRKPHLIASTQFVADLGRGEAEVLMLCVNNPDHMAILDDKQARMIAHRLGLRFTGTLGVLLSAKTAGLIERVSPILDKLERLEFRVSIKTRKAVLAKAGE